MCVYYDECVVCECSLITIYVYTHVLIKNQNICSFLNDSFRGNLFLSILLLLLFRNYEMYPWSIKANVATYIVISAILAEKSSILADFRLINQ